MDLPIKAFEIMAEIAKENNIKSVRWAEASGLSPSQISQFKRITKQTKAGAAEPEPERDVGGHIFSLDTFFRLWDALKRLVGKTALRRGLMRQLEIKKVSTRVKIFLRLMVFTDSQLKLVDVFPDAVLHWADMTSSRNKS